MPSHTDAAAPLEERYGPGLRRRFIRWRLQHADVEDAVQEVFVCVLDADRIDDLDAWVGKVARNVFVNIVRRHKSAPVPSDRLDETAVASDPLGHMDDQERRLACDRAVRQLPRDLREVILLQIRDGLRSREIAARLGISHGAAMKRMWKAKCRLKELLDRFR